MTEHDHEYKYEITVRKHLPGARQYVPADMISVRARSGETPFIRMCMER
jgi:hypothetical protein